nr:hypothetical protein [uncultured Cupriavidus sp.]
MKTRFRYAPPVNRPLLDNGLRGFGVQADPMQFTATDDKETAILHIFIDSVIFTFSTPDFRPTAVNFFLAAIVLFFGYCP